MTEPTERCRHWWGIGGPCLADVDPRALRCTQPWVLHQHVSWYLTGGWERTGTTSADRGKAHNRYPLIYQDQWGDQVLFAGPRHAGLLAALSRPMMMATIFERL